ncbi:MAG: PAS domain S-box protein [Bacteroidetes bacterium]|nr:PAS domain S-box protein [Bacteroidota bacterium]
MLLDYKAYYKSIIEFSRNSVYTEDNDGAITSWNKGSEKFYGYKSKEILGKNSSLLLPEDSTLENLDISNNIKSGKPVNDYITQRKSKSELITARISISPIFNDNNEVIGSVTFSEYVNASRQNAERKNIEDDLLKSMKETSDYKYALDESSIVAITDQRGIIKHVNDNFCKISKYSREELIGQDHRIINSSFHSKSFIKNIWTTIANGKIWKGELKNKAKDGTYYWVDTTIVPFLNEAGKPYQYIAIRADITERKKIEDDLQKTLKEISDYKYALDESSIVAITDQRGIIKHANENFCRISQYSRDELIGHDHRIINSSYHPKEFIKNLWGTIANGKIWRGELKNKTKYGNFYWVDTTIVPFLDENGKPYQYVAIRADITSRKQAEEEIKKLNEELEERVAQRTHQLEVLNNELESFSYSISHDLRAPLRAINGYSYIIQSKYEENFDEEGKRLFNRIIVNTKKMGLLIDDLLSFSRLGRKEILKIPFSMQSLIENILAEMKQSDKIPDLMVTVDVKQNATADITMIRQVWENLISNAIKYSSKKEKIQIVIGSQAENDFVKYFITDNGVGFNMDYADKLFNVFQRLHSEEEFEGIGVGLAIVKKIVTKHGGSVFAEGKENEGATFYFTLPDGV